MSETSSTAAPVEVARPRASLAVAMLGFFVVALDAQIVNVALPHIRADLGGGMSGLQWIVTGYTLMFSALQLFGGTMSDRIGARRAFGIGMVVFVVGSAAAFVVFVGSSVFAFATFVFAFAALVLGVLGPPPHAEKASDTTLIARIMSIFDRIINCRLQRKSNSRV